MIREMCLYICILRHGIPSPPMVSLSLCVSVVYIDLHFFTSRRARFTPSMRPPHEAHYASAAAAAAKPGGAQRERRRRRSQSACPYNTTHFIHSKHIYICYTIQIFHLERNERKHATRARMPRIRGIWTLEIISTLFACIFTFASAASASRGGSLNVCPIQIVRAKDTFFKFIMFDFPACCNTHACAYATRKQ